MILPFPWAISFSILLVGSTCETIQKGRDIWSLATFIGKTAEIHYGTGAISGFFSQDHVQVGDLVIQSQVKYKKICNGVKNSRITKTILSLGFYWGNQRAKLNVLGS